MILNIIIAVLLNFFTISGSGRHFKSEWRRSQDKSGRPAKLKFSALNVDFISPSLDPIGLTKPAHAIIKETYPLNSLEAYFTTVGGISRNCCK